MARKQKKADNAAVTLLKGLLAGLVEAAEDGDEEATAIIEEAGLSLGGESADADADEDDDDDDDDEDDDADEEGEDDYSEMSLKELRALAKERGIKVPRGSKEDDIIDLLEEADEEADEDEDDADEDEEGDDDDYSEMSLKELRALAKERGIKVPRGSKEDDIIDLLEEADEEGDDDDEDEDDEDEDDVDYSEMSLKELKAECKSQGIKVPRGADEEELIELLEGGDDEDEDDADEDEDDDDDIPDLDEMDDKELVALAKKLGLKGRANADKAYDFLADHYGLEEEDEDADDADEDEDDWDDED